MSLQRVSFHRRLVVVASLIAILAAAPALAYVGPGAGFALVSGFLVVFTTIVLAFLSLLVWPFRMLWRMLRRRGRGRAQIRRFIVVGLDGQDPRITDRLMAAGQAPQLQAARRPGRLLAAADRVPVALAGGVVVVLDRHQPGDAQHLRLRRARQEDLSAEAGVDRDRQARAHAQDRPLAHSARAAATAAAAQVEAVLDHPRRERHLEHGAARADHLPARQVLRRAALGDDGARPPGHARHLPPLHDAAGRRRGRGRPALPARALAATATPGRGVLQGPENSFRDGNPPLELPIAIDGRSRARQGARHDRQGDRSSSRRASSATG